MVGLVLVTHCNVAASLLEAAALILGEIEQSHAVCLTPDLSREASWTALSDAVSAADTGDGVLVLADMFGGTPSNLSLALLADRSVEVLTGVNLPMVLRTVQRRSELSLDALGRDVLAYGRRNVTSASDWLAPVDVRP